MFDTVRTAEIRTAELARLLGVCRQTASGWLHGQAVPHRLHSARVQAILDAVNLAVESGQLPPPRTIRGAARQTYIEDVVRGHCADQGLL